MEFISDLSKIIGSFRAENLGEDLFSLYTKPAYFPQLLTPIPCLLQGGRGTGKTTVLKSMSYTGQYLLLDQSFEAFKKQDYIGVYYKLETGIVSAFSGGGKTDEYWQHAFAHFINLQLCKLLCEFALWHEVLAGYEFSLNKHQLKTFCISTGIEHVLSLRQINEEIDIAIARLEGDINYAADSNSRRQTPIGATPRRLVNLLRETVELKDKTFYFLLDEYENLQKYQQIILNTFIKQADAELTFKIGIRELGFKSRHTLNPNEQLIDPADLVLIDISNKLNEEEFEIFAGNVLENRFNELRNKGNDIPMNFPDMLEKLSEEQEATKLGGEILASTVKDKLLTKVTSSEAKDLESLSIKDLLMIRFSVVSHDATDDQYYTTFKQIFSDPGGWKNKLNNYGYAALFTLRSKKVGISKYYCGWDTFLALSGRNIRYLLQLVTNSLVDHMKEGKSLSDMISPECQTKVASEVGRKNLWELEGLSIRGAQLMKVVLGFGELFHRMAVKPEGHAPEVSQFEISHKRPSDDESAIQVADIVSSAIMHLALVRSAGTKLSGKGDTKDFDYMLHPIFSAFFVYGHRKKRKISITQEEIMGMINNSSKTITSLLLKQNRIEVIEDITQLTLFGDRK